MGCQDETISFLREQLRRWPLMELQDLRKALYQSVFGCGHFVGPEAETLLEEELAETDGADEGMEPLCGPWCRFHLSHLMASGLAPETLFRVFQLSGGRKMGTAAQLEERLAVLLELAERGDLPWSGETVRRQLAAWKQAGYPALHHSETFRQAYHPRYRVLHRDFVWMLPLLREIDRLRRERGGGLVAIEGGSASGKTTLARELQAIYPCAVFHMDDFFLRPEQRTAARLAEPGGNVDRERFLEEVLLPVTRGETVSLRRYDCCTQRTEPPVLVEPQALTIVEGAYSMHPDLAEHYSVSVFLSVDPKVQHARIEVRNEPEQQVRFFNTWIPLEQRYFQATGARERCDLTLEVTT